jgi:hypothetical protein
MRNFDWLPFTLPLWLPSPVLHMTLAQEIVVSSVFSIIEILVIEDHKLNSTFLHVAFGSQSLLEPTSDQTVYGTN